MHLAKVVKHIYCIYECTEYNAHSNISPVAESSWVDTNSSMGVGPGMGSRGVITIVAVGPLSGTERVRNSISKRIAANKRAK